VSDFTLTPFNGFALALTRAHGRSALAQDGNLASIAPGDGLVTDAGGNLASYFNRLNLGL
jgi:hypothetical protein